MEMNRPDLVVPYQDVPLRDKVYPYVITVSIITAVFLFLVMISINGVY